MNDHYQGEQEERLEFNPEAQALWKDIARWARFLSVTGVVLYSLVIAFSLFSVIYMLSLSYISEEAWYSIYRMVFLLITCLVHLFILIRLIQFSGRMGRALKEGNELHLRSALGSLRMVFRSFGIFMIVFLIFYTMVYLIKSTL